MTGLLQGWIAGHQPYLVDGMYHQRVVKSITVKQYQDSGGGYIKGAFTGAILFVVTGTVPMNVADKLVVPVPGHPNVDLWVRMGQVYPNIPKFCWICGSVCANNPNQTCEGARRLAGKKKAMAYEDRLAELEAADDRAKYVEQVIMLTNEKIMNNQTVLRPREGKLFKPNMSCAVWRGTTTEGVPPGKGPGFPVGTQCERRCKLLPCATMSPRFKLGSVHTMACIHAGVSTD